MSTLMKFIALSMKSVPKVLHVLTYTIVLSVIGLFLLQVFSGGVFAQVDPIVPINPISGTDNLLDWVQNALNIVIGITALIAVAVLVYSGIIYITAAGDEGKISSATKGITFAIVGLIIAFIAVLIVNFVLSEILGQNTAS